MFTRLLGVSAALLALAAPARADLITNGSFEAGSDPNATGSGFITLSSANSTSTGITGWTVSTGTVDYIGSYWQASNGSRSVDLSGLVGSAGSLSQTFATTPGQSYQVFFDLAGNPDMGPTVKPLTVTAGATAQQYAFDTTGHTHTNMGWTPESFLFTATGTSTTLTFTSGTNSGYGPALDNVSVSAVPEPASLAVMGFGAVGIAGYVRRRKVAAAV